MKNYERIIYILSESLESALDAIDQMNFGLAKKILKDAKTELIELYLMDDEVQRENLHDTQ